MNVRISSKAFRDIRERRVLTQAEFGKAIGLSVNGVQRIEGNIKFGLISHIRPATFRRLAELEETTPEQLFSKIGGKPSDS